MPPPRSLLVGVFLLLAAIWGTTWAAIQIGLQGIPPFTGVSLRFAIAAGVILVGAWMRGIPLGRTTAERWLWLVNGALAFSLSYGVVYWGEQWVPSGLTSVLFSTYPLFVTLLAHFALPGERLTWAAAAGALAGFGGVAVIFSEDLARLGGPQVARASAVLLVSPLVSAIATVAVKRWGAGVHPASLTGVPMAMTAAVVGVVAWGFEGGRSIRFDAVSVGALLYLALAGTVVTFLLYYWLLAHAPATRVALLAYAIPVVAVSIGVSLRGEALTARVLAGAALVVAGVAVAVHGPRLRSRRRPDPALPRVETG